MHMVNDWLGQLRMIYLHLEKEPEHSCAQCCCSYRSSVFYCTTKMVVLNLFFYDKEMPVCVNVVQAQT